MTARGGIRCVAPLVLNLCTRWKRVISFNTPDISAAGKRSSHNLPNRSLRVNTTGVYVLEKRKPFAPKMNTSLMYGIQQIFRTFFRNAATNMSTAFFWAITQRVVVIYLRNKNQLDALVILMFISSINFYIFRAYL